MEGGELTRHASQGQRVTTPNPNVPAVSLKQHRHLTGLGKVIPNRDR